MLRSLALVVLAATGVLALSPRDTQAGNCPPQVCGAGVGSWTQASAPAIGLRDYHAASLLNEGRVLLSGGTLASDPLTVTASSVIYSPTHDTWSTAASMPAPRMVHTSTLLNDGRVLVTGGTDTTGTPLASTAVYSAASNSWAAGGSMSTARVGHSAHRLSDGRVLVIGGSDSNGVLASAEVFEPSTGTFSPVSALAEARTGHASLLEHDGAVRVCAGAGISGPVGTCERYDPALNVWQSAATTAACHGRAGAETFRQYVTSLWVTVTRGGEGEAGVDCGGSGSIGYDDVAVMNNGYVLFHNGPNPVEMVYNPTTFGMIQYPWIYTYLMPQHPGVAPSVTRLYDGRALISGGNAALLYTIGVGGVMDNDGDGYANGAEHALDQRTGTYCATMRADVKMDGTANVLDLVQIAMQFDVLPLAPRYDQNADATLNVIDLQIAAMQNGKKVVACP